MSINNGKSSLGVHFFYVTLILTATIILLATQQWTALPHFTDYLSTAATITSLVLALLAIIYAFISNDSLAKATGVVTEAAFEAQNSTAKISVLLGSVESLTHGADESNAKLAETSEEFKTQMSALAATVSDLARQANAISDVLPEIPKGLNAIERRFDEFSQSGKAPDIGETLPAKDLDAVATAAVKNASPAGLMLMYACYLSKQTAKPFDLPELFEHFPEYLRGYLICLRSLGIVRIDKEKYPSVVEVTECAELLKTARDEYVKRMEENKERTGKYKLYKRVLDKVDSFFAEGDEKQDVPQ